MQIHEYLKVILSFLLATASQPILAGGVISSTGQIDVDAMADYSMLEYAGPPSERDPFTTSDKMYQLSGQQTATGGFVPYMSAANLPKMRIRGILHNGPGDTMALLQIDGEETVHLVRKGDQIGVQTRAGQPNTILEVVNVDQKKVEVQTGLRRQIIIVQ